MGKLIQLICSFFHRSTGNTQNTLSCKTVKHAHTDEERNAAKLLLTQSVTLLSENSKQCDELAKRYIDSLDLDDKWIGSHDGTEWRRISTAKLPSSLKSYVYVIYDMYAAIDESGHIEYYKFADNNSTDDTDTYDYFPLDEFIALEFRTHDQVAANLSALACQKVASTRNEFIKFAENKE